MLNECIRRYFFPLSSQRNKEAKKKKKRLISGYLPICVSVSLYSTLSSYLILAVCRKCVTYEPSKWLGSLPICVSVSLYSTLSSLLIVEVCRTCVSLFTLFLYSPQKIWRIYVDQAYKRLHLVETFQGHQGKYGGTKQI